MINRCLAYTTSPGKGLQLLFSCPQFLQSSRLLFVSQSLLDVPIQSSIGTLVSLDHAPIHLTLDHIPKLHRGFSWRLNDNLLKDSLCVADVKLAIRDFVLDHRSDDVTTPLTQWEALKCVISSVFIKHGSWLKKAVLWILLDCSPR